MFTDVKACAKPADKLRAITGSDNKYAIQKDASNGAILLTPILDNKNDPVYQMILNACTIRLRAATQPDDRRIDITQTDDMSLFLTDPNGHVLASTGIYPTPKIITVAKTLAIKSFKEPHTESLLTYTPKKASGDLLVYPIATSDPDNKVLFLDYVMGFIRPTKDFDFMDTPELSMTADILARYIQLNARKD